MPSLNWKPPAPHHGSDSHLAAALRRVPANVGQEIADVREEWGVRLKWAHKPDRETHIKAADREHAEWLCSYHRSRISTFVTATLLRRSVYTTEWEPVAARSGQDGETTHG